MKLGAATAVALLLLPTVSAAQQLRFDPNTTGSLPVPIPSPDLQFVSPQVDPRVNPGVFMGMPIPIPGDRIVAGQLHGYDYRMNEAGVVMGRTPYGYAMFRSFADYEAFYEAHM